MILFIVIVGLLIGVIIILFLNIVFAVSEHEYGLIFGKPFFIYWYPNLKSLSPNQSYVLYKQFQYFNQLNSKKKKYFEHRVASFIEKYEFIGKEDFVITDETKILIASTSIMLTFGMRNYLFDCIEKIIVYPTVYYSTVKQEYHKGEFHPAFKAIVFSWEDFKNGYEISNDNLNLGIHEFSHVLHYHGMKNEDASAIIFARYFDEIKQQISIPANREKLINSNYFRIYAFTNQFEFLAVIIEHYFETPQIFKQEFPELYENVNKMLNLKR